MHIIIPGILLLILIFGPSAWARYTFSRYNKPSPHFPGTGAELARHLLNRFDLPHVKVEITEVGDHYDPESKTVRLSPQYYNAKSLSAITIAAHEVGHAIQDAQNHPMLALRSRLVKTAITAERLGSIAIIGIPVITALTRAPSAGMLMFVVALGSMLVSTLVHLVTLPVEWDASFGKAMPILKAGEYISEKEQLAAKQILRAAALTYFASSLISLLNVGRWIRVLWRR